MTTRLIDADQLAGWLDDAARNADGAEATAYQRVARLVRAHADRTTRCPSCHTEPDRPHTDYCLVTMTEVTIATPAHCGPIGGPCFYPATCTLTYCEVRNGR